MARGVGVYEAALAAFGVEGTKSTNTNTFQADDFGMTFGGLDDERRRSPREKDGAVTADVGAGTKRDEARLLVGVIVCNLNGTLCQRGICDLLEMKSLGKTIGFFFGLKLEGLVYGNIVICMTELLGQVSKRNRRQGRQRSR